MNLFVVGKVLKSRGLKGEVKVRIITDFPESFLERTSYFLGENEHAVQKVHVQNARLHKEFAFLFFEGVSTVEEADLLKGQVLFVDESQLMQVGEDFAYEHELLGLSVFNEHAEPLGTLVAFEHMPSCDVYEIETIGKKRIMLPAVDEFIVKVDIPANRVVVRRFDEFL